MIYVLFFLQRPLICTKSAEFPNFYRFNEVVAAKYFNLDVFLPLDFLCLFAGPGHDNQWTCIVCEDKE
jgi:hypothetical protein